MLDDSKAYSRQLEKVNSPADFNELALALFHYQFQHCQTYREFVSALGVDPTKIQAIGQIPFLPIEVFKSHEVKCGSFKPEAVFTSSGTSGMTHSSHAVKDLGLYEWSFMTGFCQAYGLTDADFDEWCVIGLLPSYLERTGSSLIYMVNHMIERTQANGSGFYLHAEQQMFDALNRAIAEGRKVLLIGVSYALIAIAEAGEVDLSGVVVMETGGMKGMRKEMVRSELHQLLEERFRVSEIHSEYGMTELLSQAYSH